MTEQHREAQSEKKNGHKPQTAPVLEPANEFAGVAEIPVGLIGLDGDGNIQSQSARLNDPRLYTVQRQAMAARIGQLHGNQHLQRLLQTHAPKSHVVESRRSLGDADVVESAEAEGLGAGGALSFVGANPPPNGSGKDTSTVIPLIQREDEDDEDRPSEEERARALAKARASEQVAGQKKSEGRADTAKTKNEGETQAEAAKTAKGQAQQATTEAKSIKEKRHADSRTDKAAHETALSAAPKGAPGEAETEGTGEGVEVEKKAPASPQEDPAFQAVVGRAKKTASRQRQHAPARTKAAEAAAAALPPGNETLSKAQANQVGAMDQAPTPAFNAASFKAQLMERIAAMAPKSTKEADEFKEQHKLDSMKGEMQGKVNQEKASSQSALQDKTKAPPDPSGIEPKPVKELPPADPGTAPASIGAKDAAPKAKTHSEVEKPFQENSKALDKQMADENVTEQQLAKSNEPEFQEALSSKQEAQTQAAKAPQEYRSYEGEQVNQAKTQAAGTAQSHLHSMHGGRAQVLAQIVGKQTGAKAREEAARAKVASDIQKIYDKTKTKVEAILGKLDTDASAAFDAGSKAANRTFEDYVASKMDAYKEDRYGGWFGWARWAKDKIKGMPKEVNIFYSDGRARFIQQMDAVVGNVAEIIARGLNEAKAEVAKGKKEIETYVAQLPSDLRDVGTKAANDIQDKFDSLESKIDAKQNELIEQLATKYNEKLKAVDARIEELKAANQGLIDKAVNFVKGVIRVIKKLKDMIVNILSRIADVVMGIISDPIGFLGNLIDGIKSGLDNFISNLPRHLLNALLTWLTGELGPMGIKLPDNIFSLEGIFSLVMQILGVNWDTIRAKAVKLLGENVVKALETGFEIFQVLINEGPIGLWKYVKEMFGNIKEMVIDGIMDLIQTEVIQAGIKWILGLLTPAGAFIKAAMAIYDIVKFFINNASKIADLIEAIIDGIAEIAKGSISGAAKLIENALAKALPIVIGFLASLLGIGDLSNKVKGLIEKIRTKVDKAVEWIIMKAQAAAGKVMGVLGFGKKEDPAQAVEAAPDGVGVHSTFEMEGEQHEIDSQEGSAVLVLSSSTPTLLNKHPSKEVRDAYAAYLQEIAAATSPTAKKSAANRNVTIIVAKIKAAGQASAPGASAPGIGTIDMHKNQQSRLQKTNVKVWHMESEHVIPRAFVNAAFEALAQAGVPAGGADYKNMHTILIYLGAADKKTEGASSDQGKINDFKAAVAEMREEVELRTKPSARARAREEMAGAIFSLLSAFSGEAQDRTNSAIVEENRENSQARGPEGKPEPPTPTPSQVSSANAAQSADINEQLQTRIDNFLAKREREG